MNTRTTAAALCAATLLTLTACSSSNDDAKSTSTPSVNHSSAEAAAGIPPKPDAATRTALLAVLKAINPALVADEDKAIDNARNQCSTINGGGNADASAQARFSTSDHEVTAAEAQAINAALKSALCTS
jgi:peptidoglycan hydrolase-like protein with peptidoglycan-binding domain